MKRRLTIFTLVTAVTLPWQALAVADKPNILMIMSDDVGITNISAYSHGLMGYQTPNIDRIAKGGMRFDRCFVTNICNGDEDRALAMAMIAMAKALNLTVIAEGIETQAQYDFVKDLGCDYIQGYLVGVPEAFCQVQEPQDS